MSIPILHRPDHYKYYKAFDSVVLHVDLEMEFIRANLILSRMRRHLREFKAQPYPGLHNPSPVVRCFDTAFAMAEAHGLIYCEGLMIFDTPAGPLPVGHGFNVTPEGIVVDATSTKYQHDPRVHFVGVPIKLEYARAWYAEVGWHGLLDGYSDGTLGRIYSDDPCLWKETVNG